MSRTTAQEQYQDLRDAVGLECGGQVYDRTSLEQVAEHFGITTDDKTITDINYVLVTEVLGSNGSRDGCRDWHYLTGSEHEALADEALKVAELKGDGWTVQVEG